MKKRKLVNQMVSFIMAFVMIIGCLANMPAMANAATSTEVAEDVTVEEETEEVVEDTAEDVSIDDATTDEMDEIVDTVVDDIEEEVDYSALNEEIYNNLEDYPTLDDMEEGEPFYEDAIEVESVEDYYQLINGNAMVMTADGDTVSETIDFPSEVDNSTNENKQYLPKVLNQYNGSCVSYAYVYALGSYTINQARGISSKDANNVLSPLFAHNIIRSGTKASYGSYASVANRLMLETGAPLAKYAPITDTISHYDHTWYPTEEVWNSATDNRIEKVVHVPIFVNSNVRITSPNDSDLDIIKATLSSGKIIGFTGYFNTYNYTKIPSESPSHANEHAIDRCDYYVKKTGFMPGRDYGGHAMVIVGYDDNIWIDVNRDGKQQTAEFGALKIMNSHGYGYKNRGFVWIAYDALNKVSAVITDEDVERVNAAIDAGEMTGNKINNENRTARFDNMYTYIASGEESASSGCRLVATINTNKREYINISIEARSYETGTIKTYDVFAFNVPYAMYWGGRAFDGTQNSMDGTIVVDLDNVIPNITPETMDEYDWKVIVKKAEGFKDKITVKDLHIKVNGVECWYGYKPKVHSEDGDEVHTYTMHRSHLQVELTGSKRRDITEGEQIEFKVETLAGCYDAEHLEYQFSVRSHNNTDEKIIRDYSSEASFIWMAECIYDEDDFVAVDVHVRDKKTGHEDGSTWNYMTINEAPYVSSITINNDEKLELGKPLEIIINGEGGTGDLQKIIIISCDGGKQKLFYKGETDKAIVWTPERPGTYVMWLGVEDENGIRSEFLQKTFEVPEIDFELKLSTPVDEITEGMAVEITVESESTYDYRFLYRTDMKTIVIADYENNETSERTVCWNAEYSYGNNGNLYVSAKEKTTGCTLTKTVSFKVNPTPYIVDCTIESGEMNIGETKDINVGYGGGTGTINKILEISYNGGEKTLYERRENGWIEWTPEKIGTYNLWISIEDENGIRDTREVTIEVLGVDIKSFVASEEPSETTEGMDVIFSVDSKGGFDVQYQYVYYPGMGETKIIKDYSYDTTCIWTAEHSYYNPTVVVYVKDMVTGEIVSKSIDFKVNKAPSISGCSITSGEMDLGESKRVLISGSGGTGTLNRIVEVSYNGGDKTVYYSGPQKMDLYWTPDKAGTYTLWLSLEDENGIRATHEVIVDVSVLKVTSFQASRSAKETTEGMEVIFTVETKNGVDVQYQYVFDNGMKKTIIKDYSYDTTCIWTAEYTNYNSRIIVYAKDMVTGEVATAAKNFNINKAPYISGCSMISGEMELGESKQVLISGSGGTGTLNRVLEVSYNGGEKSLYYSGPQKMDLYWTPDKAGTYTLWSSLEDENGIRATYEATIYVKNTVAVYYYNSSYSNAYIHYKVDNGSWTSVPGVKMESSNEQDGYKWKYVIDLGTETGATVCFNNGNGSWDSRNGANYTVGVGNYGIKNNVVSQLEEVSSIRFTVDKISPVSVTDSATLSVTVNGSTDSYEYRFGTIFGGEEIILSNGYTDSSSCIMSMSNVIGNVNANAVGTHTLFVDVKNTTTGEVERATIDNYVVEGLKITSFTADKVSPQVTGTSIALSVIVENEATYSYNTYKFSAIKDGVETAISPSAEYSATWTPTEAGTYTLKYYIVDNYGQTATKTMEYVVKDASATTTTIYYSNSSWSQAYIHYQIGNGSWTSVPGVKMSTNTSGNGYTWKYVLDLGSASSATVCFNNGNGSWDSKNGSNYTLGLGVFGIKNSTITELEEKLSVSVSADKSVGGTYNTTTFTAVATNGTAPYTYKIAVVTAGTTPTDSSYVTANSNGTYLYTPYTAGSYTVYAKVTDANGDVAVTSMSYTIEGPKWSSFTATATDNKVGTAVTLKAEFVNCQYDPYNTYSFVVEKNGASTTYSAGSTGYYVWTPTEEGTYTITARFTTFDGYSYTKSMTYEVSSDKANTVTVYYNSSWTKANIHYCVAGGSWTAVPGVAMTATSEKSGYTHKYVIDLGDATSATICFNNGSGTWDSQNGRNYTVYAGTYGVSGGAVYKLD